MHATAVDYNILLTARGVLRASGLVEYRTGMEDQDEGVRSDPVGVHTSRPGVACS